MKNKDRIIAISVV